jgi:hypothetical protein
MSAGEPRRIKKKPMEKKLKAGSLKYLKSSIGPGSRGGRRERRIRLHAMRMGRSMNATILADHANPRDGTFMIFEMIMGQI